MGPNGLVLANYLARAGLEVAVVECVRTIGGGLSTQEITLPLFKHNLHALFMRWTPNFRLWTDLDLGSTGVRMILPEKQNALPTSEGRVLIAYNDPERTKQSIAKFATEDAESFATLLGRSILNSPYRRCFSETGTTAATIRRTRTSSALLPGLPTTAPRSTVCTCVVRATILGEASTASPATTRLASSQATSASSRGGTFPTFVHIFGHSAEEASR